MRLTGRSSSVEYAHGVRVVAGSIPVVPTIKKNKNS
jgi:hypothetical protein